MKVRLSFVSNSSSSSFVLEVPKWVNSPEAMKKYLFGDEDVVDDKYYGSFSAEHIARRIYRDIQAKKPATHEEIVREISSSSECYDEIIEITDRRLQKESISGDPCDSIWCDIYNEEAQFSSCFIVDKFIADVGNDSDIYIVEYYDSDPESAFIECGAPFKNVNHLKMSHH